MAKKEAQSEVKSEKGKAKSEKKEVSKKEAKSEKSEKSEKGKKSKATNKGSVGFLCGGMLKSGTMRLFKSSDREPESLVEEMTQYYGSGVEARYVNCEDYESVFDNYAEAMKDVNECSDMYNSHINTAMDKLKEVSGEKKSHRCKTGDEEETKKEASKSKSNEDAIEESDNEVSEDDGEEAEESDNEDAEESEESEKEEEPPKKSKKGASNKKQPEKKEKEVKESKDSKSKGKSKSK